MLVLGPAMIMERMSPLPVCAYHVMLGYAFMVAVRGESHVSTTLTGTRESDCERC